MPCSTVLHNSIKANSKNGLLFLLRLETAVLYLIYLNSKTRAHLRNLPPVLPPRLNFGDIAEEAWSCDRESDILDGVSVAALAAASTMIWVHA